MLLGVVRAFVQLYLEVEGGRRSRRQLQRFMSPQLYATLTPYWVRPGHPGRVCSVSGVRTRGDRFDTVSVVRRGQRYGAVAVRLQRHAGRWWVDRVDRPEDGPLPTPEFLPPDDDLADDYPAPSPARMALCGDAG